MNAPSSTRYEGLTALARALRECSAAEDAAEALLDALSRPTSGCAAPSGARVQLGGQALVARGALSADPAQLWQLMRAKPGPILVGAAPEGPDGWQRYASPWPEALTLLWPIEQPSGAVAGVVALAYAVAPPVLPDPEQAQLLTDAAASRLLGLPVRAAPPCPGEGPMLPVVGRLMRPVIETLEAYARTEEVILLRGPTGTGKSRLASWCWARSPRSGRRLVVANLLGVPDTGQDAELFGVRKGTFTGVGERIGQLQSAQLGTLFIDEVDKLALQTQARLLRVLDERRYYVVGEPREHSADVRFIVASNTDLEVAVAERRFLEDLYYRVNVMPVTLPALAERPDEIGAWTRHMATELHTGRGGQSVSLASEAEFALRNQSWPGNLRQLHNVVRRAYAFATLEVLSSSGGLLPPTIELTGAHFNRALDGTHSSASTPDTATLEALRRAALGLVNAVQQRRMSGVQPLSDRDGDLELADAFRGLVLMVAADQLGDTRRAFELFGLTGRFRGGNHLRTWRLANRQMAMLRYALARGA